MGNTVDVAVVVPVLQRPDAAGRFMTSLTGSTDRARVYAVAHAEDEATIAAWVAAGANVQTTWVHTFAHKVNHAYRNTGEPWLFIVGDDVKFHPGWADEAIRAAKLVGAKVVGTNDLTNERVMKGQHASHMLISRDYVAAEGASWDGPGVVCHEGYRHMYVDDEIVTVAKQRGVFAVAVESVVEHLHPLNGQAEVDETYRLGWSAAERDKATFVARMEANAR